MIRQWASKIGWRLFALAAAFALWVTFIGSPEVITSISAPVEYQNMPAGLETTSELPARIYLEIRGPEARLHRADLSGTSVMLNLGSVQDPGERTFSIEPRNVDLPAGVRLMRAVPAEIRLSFERRDTVPVPVKVRFAAPPPQGYRIVSVEVHPARLQITGPASRVRQVGYVETDPIDLSHSIGKEQFQTHTFIGDPQVRFVSTPVVQVKVALERTQQGGAAPNAKTVIRN